ncbi:MULTISPECIES: sensor domain-containing diguanylate cyclase [Giesbergeria]|uniref:Diguanylate cyclase n=1 Tax=Giesbergeria sinuosa TaxID=80883 RepID=A0ABV9QDR8_9BURK
MLISSFSLHQSVFEHLPDAVYLIDPQTSNILDCNAAALHQVGLPRDEVVQHSVLSLQKDVIGIEQWASIAQAVREAQGQFVFIGRHRHRSGAEVPVEVTTSAFMHQGCEYFVSVARDIGRRLALEQDLNDRDVQLRYALTEASDGLWDWNLLNNEVFFSPQLKRMLGYGPHEMKPTLETWATNVHPDDASRVRRALQEHIKGLRERYEAEYRLRNRNGHYLWVHDRGRVCERDAQGQPIRVVGMVQNITDRKHAEQALQMQASHDALTGLLNRRECERILQQQLQRCQQQNLPLGLCLFDLDHFKDINDRFGHQTGDLVLRKVAHEIQAHVRAADYLFRWGGEEFLLVSAGAPCGHVLHCAQRLRARLAELDWPEVPGLHGISCSFGVAMFPEHGQQADDLFLAADSALYRAKAQGRNRVELAVMA